MSIPKEIQTEKQNQKKIWKTVEICFVFSPKKTETHSSQNKYLDINIDGVEHYKQPTGLLKQAI